MSSSELRPVLDVHLDQTFLQEVQDQTRDFACAHGILMRKKQPAGAAEVVCHAPFSLFPSPVPRVFFDKVWKLQEALNMLMYKVSQNREFLTQTLSRTIEVDDFTRGLFQIYQQVHNEGCIKPVELGLLRTDYMLDTGRGEEVDLELSMVEINTMASSFGGLASKIPLLHRYVLKLCSQQFDPSSIPDNAADSGLAEAMYTAFQLYGQPSAVVLFVVRDGESNIFDQRILEFAIKNIDHRVKIMRRSLTDIGQSGQLREEDRRLFIDDQEIAIVYYRMGYVPTHFPTEVEWKAKLICDQSRAAICPSISWHLAGAKKIQQELAKPGVLEQFIQDRELAQLMRTTFAGQYSLDLTPEGDKAAEKGITNPQKYVMKPQREGGGNNIYDDEVRTTLLKLKGSQEREAFILMDRILPPILQNYILRDGQENLTLLDVVSELGIFGTFVSLNGEVKVNKTVGHLLRTKDTGQNEGGVAAGASCIDSPFLI